MMWLSLEASLWVGENKEETTGLIGIFGLCVLVKPCSLGGRGFLAFSHMDY
jgi:hypothetical protein